MITKYVNQSFLQSDLFYFLLCLISACLLGLPFYVPSLFFTVWIGWIPFLYVIEKLPLKKVYYFSLLMSFSFIAFIGYWIYNFSEISLNLAWYLSLLIAVLAWFYTAHSIIVPVLLHQWLKPYFSRFVSLCCFASMLTLSLSLFPAVFPYTFSSTQLSFLTVLQPIDITGELGIDFLILLVNITLFDFFFLSQRKTKNYHFLVGTFLVIWLAIGAGKQYYWNTKIESWHNIKTIGLVQPNHPIQYDDTPHRLGNNKWDMPLEMEMSQQATAKQKFDFLVWPEGFFYRTFYNIPIRNAFGSYVREMQTPIIYVDIDHKVSIDKFKENHYLASVYMNKQGVIQNKYYKMKLVPFGEKSPFILEIPFIRDWFADFIEDGLTAGKEAQIFPIENVNLAPVLCYESLFPFFVVKAIRKGTTHGKMLLVQSQDVWYGHTIAAWSHMKMSAIRAIENRVPLIHVINNGPSNAFLPNGKLIAHAPMFKQVVQTIAMPFDETSGGSFFTQYPYTFISILVLFTLFYIIQGLVAKYVKKQ